MQLNFVAVAVTALVATAAAATNSTNGTNTNGTIPAVPPTDDENVAFNNAVSGGLLGAVVAAGLVLVL